MAEKEIYKSMLKKIIDDTEQERIQSTHEVIHALIEELESKTNIKADTSSLTN